jgi:hypothetical protein
VKCLGGFTGKKCNGKFCGVPVVFQEKLICFDKSSFFCYACIAEKCGQNSSFLIQQENDL